MTNIEIILTTALAIAIGLIFWYRWRWVSTCAIWEREQVKQMEASIVDTKMFAEQLKRKNDKIHVLEHRLDVIAMKDEVFLSHFAEIVWAESKVGGKSVLTTSHAKSLIKKAVATYTSSTKK